MSDFRDLKAWDAAHRLALRVYALTSDFPPRELFGLTSQLRRAATSVGSDLAEGCGRGSDAELRRFALIARGSAQEVISQLLLARDLGMIGEPAARDALRHAEDVGSMVSGLVRSINKRMPRR